MRFSTGILGLCAAALVAVSGVSQVQATEPSRTTEPDPEPTATIVVDALQPQRPAVTQLLGANHRYHANGSGLWNPETGEPYQVYVKKAQRFGLQSLRFPGGTVANTYDWKRAIGQHRECQVDGRGTPATGFRAITHGLSFGPDEFMGSVERLGVDPLIMVSFVRETPADAADWVEYMNAPAGDPDSNPNGGVDWADVRADIGHPEPYGVTRWEIGNEQHHLDSRHWMSHDGDVAAQEYAFGATPRIAVEPLGRGCSHPVEGIPSDGSAGQVFEVLYPPVDPATVEVLVRENGHPWRQVPDISVTRPRARVYEVRPESGEIVFGDGTHGRIPKAGKHFVASYTSDRPGYFEFVEAMKAVDPSIEVCASFGRVSFVQAATGLEFDCLTTHPITTLSKSGGEPILWTDALEGHDRMMLAAQQRRRGALKLSRALPEGTPLWFTEAAAIDGDRAAYPSWATSATQAAYMASKWGDWLELGIEWGMSSVFVGGHRAVLGPRPAAVYSAEAFTRQAIGPMMRAGGDVLAARVDGNPVRQPEGLQRSYDGLAVTATKAPDGTVHLLVVNRLPTEAVAARLQLDGHVAAEAEVTTVAGDHFTDSNTRESPSEVTLGTTTVPVDELGLVLTFPAASTTVVSLPPAP